MRKTKIIGGIGIDNHMGAFGDTLYTLTRMHEEMDPQHYYKLTITFDLAHQTHGLGFPFLKHKESLINLGLEESERDELIDFIKLNMIFSEWDLIKFRYPTIEVILPINDGLCGGENNWIPQIKLFNPEHLIITEGLCF